MRDVNRYVDLKDMTTEDIEKRISDLEMEASMRAMEKEEVKRRTRAIGRLRELENQLGSQTMLCVPPTE